MTFASPPSKNGCRKTSPSQRIRGLATEDDPSLGQQGLFYYYHTMAKGLAAANIDTLRTKDGKQIDWRNKLSNAILSTQAPDGSWGEQKLPLVGKRPRAGHGLCCAESRADLFTPFPSNDPQHPPSKPEVAILDTLKRCYRLCSSSALLQGCACLTHSLTACLPIVKSLMW